MATEGVVYPIGGAGVARAAVAACIVDRVTRVGRNGRKAAIFAKLFATVEEIGEQVGDGGDVATGFVGEYAASAGRIGDAVGDLIAADSLHAGGTLIGVDASATGATAGTTST